MDRWPACLPAALTHSLTHSVTLTLVGRFGSESPCETTPSQSRGQKRTRLRGNTVCAYVRTCTHSHSSHTHDTRERERESKRTTKTTVCLARSLHVSLGSLFLSLWRLSSFALLCFAPLPSPDAMEGSDDEKLLAYLLYCTTARVFVCLDGLRIGERGARKENLTDGGGILHVW